jgi:hypothetical protein
LVSGKITLNITLPIGLVFVFTASYLLPHGYIESQVQILVSLFLGGTALFFVLSATPKKYSVFLTFALFVGCLLQAVLFVNY